MRKLRTGTRPSRLALKQVEEIERLFPGIRFKAVTYQTPGDRDKLTPISEIEGSDFFTRDIDRALLRGEIDLAVHSSKDLPQSLTPGLAVAFEAAALSPFDAFISKDGLALKRLPVKSRVGTSSNRRKSQIKVLRPDLQIVDIRGTIEERISLIASGKIDGLIVAHAALIRLGLEKEISEVFPLNVFQTHPKQGSLSIVTREDICAKLRSILLAPARVTGS
ncbi:MAG: hydroxymethylbilane synthase [Candidatus Omnitrophica bacterium]|nr:hydroxymethylbilane synthase [Candidatus Omnitrophota bacterium]